MHQREDDEEEEKHHQTLKKGEVFRVLRMQDRFFHQKAEALQKYIAQTTLPNEFGTSSHKTAAVAALSNSFLNLFFCWVLLFFVPVTKPTEN